MRNYFVYILTNNSGSLYTGVTANVAARLLQHRKASPRTFAGRYATGRLIYFEETSDVFAALEREKEIKNWARAKKLALIREINPKWLDLGEDVLGEKWVSPKSDAADVDSPCDVGWWLRLARSLQDDKSKLQGVRSDMAGR